MTITKNPSITFNHPYFDTREDKIRLTCYHSIFNSIQKLATGLNFVHFLIFYLPKKLTLYEPTSEPQSVSGI